MDSAKASLLAKLKESKNVLITVSNNPSVDQLAACIGLTLLINKTGKTATAVFSGEIPDVLQFLKPEDTLAKTTDALRDFIIALDKSKANKLRYKVEDRVVKIFITPYHAALSSDDLEFSQGDFNVDVVLALGVHEQQELDQAIVSHGQILHDATIASINIVPGGSLGTINWVDEKASSLCEMLVNLGESFKKEAMDAQIATAFLTGIVAETKRFSNEKTTAQVMALSAKLITAGADQQLVATELQEKPKVEPPPPPPPPEPEPEPMPEPPAALPELPAALPELPAVEMPPEEAAPPEEPAPVEEPEPEEPPIDEFGTLQIDHGDEEASNGSEIDFSEGQEDEAAQLDQIHIDEAGRLRSAEEAQAEQQVVDAAEKAKADEIKPESSPPSPFGFEPNRGGMLTANPQTAGPDQSIDPLSLPPIDSQLGGNNDGGYLAPSKQLVIEPLTPGVSMAPPPPPPIADNHEHLQTLADLEKLTNSPHLQQTETFEPPIEAEKPSVDQARDIVSKVVSEMPPSATSVDPIAAIKTIEPPAPLPPVEPFLPVHPSPVSPSTATSSAVNPSLGRVDPSNLGPQPAVGFGSVDSSIAPPPVPPPMMPPMPGMDLPKIDTQPAASSNHYSDDPIVVSPSPQNPFNLPPA